MKTHLMILGLAALSLAAPAQTPTPTSTPMSASVGSEYPFNGQIGFSYSASSGALTSFVLTSSYQSNVTGPDGVIAQIPSNPPSMSVDLVANAATTVSVGGQTYSYAQVQAIVQAVLSQERTRQLQQPTPTPTPQ